MSKQINYIVKAHTDIGLVRQINEDFLGVFEGENGQLYAVADGMGGMGGGDIASRLAISEIEKNFKEARLNNDKKILLDALIYNSNKAVFNKAQKSEKRLQKMGTTIVILLIADDFGYISHIGDSRCYLIRNKNIKKLTIDHTRAQELVKRDIIKEEDMLDHPESSVLTKYIGQNTVIETETCATPIKIKEGDIYLLCSDGLYGFVKDDEILNITINNDIENASNRLLELAKEKGGKDNITFIMIKADSCIKRDSDKQNNKLSDHGMEDQKNYDKNTIIENLKENYNLGKITLDQYHESKRDVKLEDLKDRFMSGYISQDEYNLIKDKIFQDYNSEVTSIKENEQINLLNTEIKAGVIKKLTIEVPKVLFGSKTKISFNLIFCPPGIFLMGSDLNIEERQRKITISKGFWISQNLISQSIYQIIMESSPSNFKGDDLPVESISWEDASLFCEKISRLSKKHFSLPTEAQWEYACRAGTDTHYCFGDDREQLEHYAWYSKNSDTRTHYIGQKKPNNWGIYDMHGNVSEWCIDYYGKYQGDELIDPEGPPTGNERVARGGSYFENFQSIRSSKRFSFKSTHISSSLGFRVILC